MTKLNACASRYTGKERDTESGLDYFGARYYASNMGRWMSPDWSAKEEPVPYAKLDDPQSLNLYSYGMDNPIARVDDDGHDGSKCKHCSAFNGGPPSNPSPVSPSTQRRLLIGGALVAGAAIGADEIGAALATGWRAVATLATSWCIVNCGSFTQAVSSRLSEAEVDTGEHLAAQTGLHLEESAHIGEEFVDKAGKTYDAMGQPKAYEYWKPSQFMQSIDDHLNKAVDFVAIDLKGASKEQIAAITKYVSGLAKDDQARIKYVK